MVLTLWEASFHLVTLLGEGNLFINLYSYKEYYIGVGANSSFFFMLIVLGGIFAGELFKSELLSNQLKQLFC